MDDDWRVRKAEWTRPEGRRAGRVGVLLDRAFRKDDRLGRDHQLSIAPIVRKRQVTVQFANVHAIDDTKNITDSVQ